MRLKLNILLFFVLFSFTLIFAQSNSVWKPIGLTVDGKNMQNGIEAFYHLNKCNNEDVVIIKFVNHNIYKVIAEWNDAVFTKELKWTSNEKGDNKKTLTIEGKDVAIGDCSGTSQSELVVKVSEFIKKIDDFKLFKTTNFHVTKFKE